MKAFEEMRAVEEVADFDKLYPHIINYEPQIASTEELENFQYHSKSLQVGKDLPNEAK